MGNGLNERENWDEDWSDEFAWYNYTVQTYAYI